jgi:hypothetical protein
MYWEVENFQIILTKEFPTLGKVNSTILIV